MFLYSKHICLLNQGIMLDKDKIQINILIEIVYELYKKDQQAGKLRDKLFTSDGQAVGKSAPKSQTFQQSLQFDQCQ